MFLIDNHLCITFHLSLVAAAVDTAKHPGLAIDSHLHITYNLAKAIEVYRSI